MTSRNGSVVSGRYAACCGANLLGWQIAKASSSTGTASRTATGSSTISSQCARRRLCATACPAMTTLAGRPCVSPRIGRRHAVSLPWSAATRFLADGSLRCQAAGTSSSGTPGATAAWSVTTRPGSRPSWPASGRRRPGGRAGQRRQAGREPLDHRAMGTWSTRRPRSASRSSTSRDERAPRRALPAPTAPTRHRHFRHLGSQPVSAASVPAA
jgi:hypothetical protein